MKFVGAFLALIPLAYGGIEKVWDHPLASGLDERAGWSSIAAHRVIAVAFSNDGKRLAVSVLHPAVPPNTHVVIIDLASPQSRPAQFDLPTCPEDLSWSPSDQMIRVCRGLLRIMDGSFCVEESFGRFLDGRRYFTWASQKSPTLEIREACHTVGPASIEEGWFVEDVAASRGLLLLSRGDLHRIANFSTGTVKREWRSEHTGGLLRFIDGGTLVCPRYADRPTCWDVESGTAIVCKLHGFDEWALNAPVVLSGGMVFDIRANRTIAQWPRGGYVVDDRVGPHRNLVNRHLTNPAAVSPDGTLVAEGRADTIRLFRITP